MSTAELKYEAKASIDSISCNQLRFASEFLANVKRREIDAATLELLCIPGFEKSFARRMKDIKAGRTTSWREVRGAIGCMRSSYRTSRSDFMIGAK